MKVVINRDEGNLSLSPKTMKRIAELRRQQCYFFIMSIKNGWSLERITFEEAEKQILVYAFTIENPDEIPYDESKLFQISLDTISRSDADLIKTVEELGKDAVNRGDPIIVEIPDGVEFSVFLTGEFDGYESIHEEHRSWGAYG